MARIKIEVSATSLTSDYQQMKFDSARADEIAKNIGHDSVWGWCIPKVEVSYITEHTYKGTSELVPGSYSSKEEFMESPDYTHLLTESFNGIDFKLTKSREIFQQEVDQYWNNLMK
jgi:hypothetical protein